jgi:DNA mismatch endonuclease, patch repair protein
MARIRAKDTKPELALRQAVHAEGARFRVHVSTLPGRPDLANRRAKVAVFVDGCFWHGCPKHFVVPRTRAEFWREKVRRNQARRRAVRELYVGWRVVEVYECTIARDSARAGEAIAKLLVRAAD